MTIIETQTVCTKKNWGVASVKCYVKWVLATAELNSQTLFAYKEFCDMRIFWQLIRCLALMLELCNFVFAKEHSCSANCFIILQYHKCRRVCNFLHMQQCFSARSRHHKNVFALLTWKLHSITYVVWFHSKTFFSKFQGDRRRPL